jgi:hypothetical protein
MVFIFDVCSRSALVGDAPLVQQQGVDDAPPVVPPGPEVQ